MLVNGLNIMDHILSGYSSVGASRVLDFVGIGAQKCGTTWLHENLSQHPQIRFPGGKEIHFWDAQRHLGVDWWLGLFPEAPAEVRQGEITPAYGMLDEETIAAIRTAVPALRLFYSVRNPIARAWSSAQMALGRAEMTLDEASDAWFIDHFRSAGSRRRGDFPSTLARWRSVFPADAFHLIVFDDIQATPRQVLIDLAVHLGVAPDHFERMDEAVLRRPVFEGPGHDLRPSLLTALRDLYAPQIHQLAGLIGRDLTDWLEWDGCR